MKNSLKFKNWLSDSFVIVFLYFFYTRIPYFRDYFSETHHLFLTFRAIDLFFYLAIVFLGFILLFRIFFPSRKKSKSLIFLEVLWRFLTSFFSIKKLSVSREEKTAFFSLLIRAFYFPLMINWLLFHLENVFAYGLSFKFLGTAMDMGNFAFFFNDSLFWFFFNIVFLLDTAVFAFAYLVESKKLGNIIRSVEPTLFGWVVALACYPPFNQITNHFIIWESKDSVTGFASQNANLFFNVLILLSLVIYGWASVALGFKAGNLVNRGIVSHGPYRFVRHPAYISKNFAWWIGSLPFLISAWQTSVFQMLFIFVNVVLWSLLYYFRAITEENHLLRDPEYRKYAKKIPYRFIPGVF